MTSVGLVLILLGIGVCIVLGGILRHPARHDDLEAAIERHPAGKGRDLLTCYVVNCNQPADTIIRAGFNNWLVCNRCREELEAARGEAS